MCCGQTVTHSPVVETTDPHKLHIGLPVMDILSFFCMNPLELDTDTGNCKIVMDGSETVGLLPVGYVESRER